MRLVRPHPMLGEAWVRGNFRPSLFANVTTTTPCEKDGYFFA
jgi:hypothetical protein